MFPRLQRLCSDQKKFQEWGRGGGGGYLSLPCGGGARDMFLLILLCKFKIEPPPRSAHDILLYVQTSIFSFISTTFSSTCTLMDDKSRRVVS